MARQDVLVRQLQGGHLAAADTGLLAPGALFTVDYPGLKVGAESMVVGSLRSGTNADYLGWTWGPQGTGIRIAVRNNGPGNAQGSFVGRFFGS